MFLPKNLHQFKELVFSTKKQFWSFVEGERNKNDFEEYGDCTFADFKNSANLLYVISYKFEIKK